MSTFLIMLAVAESGILLLAGALCWAAATADQVIKKNGEMAAAGRPEQLRSAADRLCPAHLDPAPHLAIGRKRVPGDGKFDGTELPDAAAAAS